VMSSNGRDSRVLTGRVAGIEGPQRLCRGNPGSIPGITRYKGGERKLAALFYFDS
jgi:hypothetical protein